MDELINLITSPICIIFYGGIIYNIQKIIVKENYNFFISTFIATLTLACSMCLAGYGSKLSLVIIWGAVIHAIANFIFDENQISITTSVNIILNLILYGIFNCAFLIF